MKESLNIMNLKRFLRFTFSATIVMGFTIFISSNEGSIKRSSLRKPRIYLPNNEGFWLRTIGTIVGGAVGMATAIYGLPAGLAGIGLTSAGVTSGSLAAIWQSYLGGNIASGSVFSVLQSISMAGAGMGTYSLLTTVGMLSGSQFGKVLIGKEELTVDPQLIEELFDFHDLDEDDSITNLELKHVLQRLEPKMLEDLDSRYSKATRRAQSDLGRIKFSEYVKLFKLKVYEGDDLKKILEGAFMEKREKKGDVYCEDVKEMLQDLRVTASEEKISDACNYVTNGELDKPFSFFQFLRIFGL